MDDIVYGSIHPEMYNDVIQHLRYNFFADEPLNKSLHLCKPGQPHDELEEFSLSVLNQGDSFLGILESTGEVSSGSFNFTKKKPSGTDSECFGHTRLYYLQVVGVVLNGIKAERCTKLYNDPKLQKIFDFLGAVDEDVEALNNYNVNSILELKILSVDMKFRGRGIAGRLYEITENFARKKGFQLMRADATALFSQRVFEKYGFTTLKEVSYNEYPSKEAPLFTVEPPHKSFKLMVKQLK
ncbi:hypothetical protein RUM44_004639 [Polyplax serrata]|uniref:N-acetyltransferase domain-containing protein n=1 Tax=Polyplax serrata TaxID=468196 RepID=A0ABR1B586_POLSC